MRFSLLATDGYRDVEVPLPRLSEIPIDDLLDSGLDDRDATRARLHEAAPKNVQSALILHAWRYI